MVSLKIVIQKGWMRRTLVCCICFLHADYRHCSVCIDWEGKQGEWAWFTTLA
jgi:hypothetical protein